MEYCVKKSFARPEQNKLCYTKKSTGAWPKLIIFNVLYYTLFDTKSVHSVCVYIVKYSNKAVRMVAGRPERQNEPTSKQLFIFDANYSVFPNNPKQSSTFQLKSVS